MHLKTGEQAPDISFKDVFGNVHWVDRRNIQLANVGKKTLVSFYREATCPFCNYRVYKLHQEMPKLIKKGFRVINIYSSSNEEVVKFFSRHSENMIMIADPEKQTYPAYGVESANFMTRARAIFGRPASLIKGNRLQVSLKGEQPKPNKGAGILPADFLIDTDGFLIETHYGKDIGDHIPMERLKQFVYA